MPDDERWVDVKGYEGFYQVSNRGRLLSIERWVKLGNNTRLMRAQFIKIWRQKNGYYYCYTSKHGKGKKWMVHRLVAKHFILNPNNLPQVNHKDGVKVNNVDTNLEWCDAFHNQRHAISTGLRRGMPARETTFFRGEIHVFDGEGKLVDVLVGKKDMELKGFKSPSVYRCVLGQQATYQGYRFVRKTK